MEIIQMGEKLQPVMEETLSESVSLKLKHPLKVNGEMLSELEYDLEALSAADLHYVSKYLKQVGTPAQMPAFDYDFQLVTFGRAVAKRMPQVALSDLMRMSALDTMAAIERVRDFLLDMDSMKNSSSISEESSFSSQ